MIAQMIIGWVIGIAIVAPTSYYFLRRQLRKHDRLLAENKAKNEAEFAEWYTKRRANMTDKQIADEQAYYKLLQNTPIEQRYKNTYRTGNSLSKDLLGFEILPK